MNLYLVERTDRVGYDEYDSDVVAAVDEKEAISLSHINLYEGLTVELVGVAVDGIKGSVLASFNAG